MKKTIDFKGGIIKVNFEKKMNSKWVANKREAGKLISIVGYDFIVDGKVFKVVATTTGRLKRGGMHAGTVDGSTVVTVPGVLSGSFPDNDKRIIEEILKR